MKIQTSEMTGAALDWAVAKCEGFTSEYEADRKDYWINRTNHAAQFLPPFGYLQEVFYPSTDWAQGGPIIEREKINTLDARGCWGAHKTYWDNSQSSRSYFGPTPLIAAMRCYVASKLGDEVEIPEGVTT
jgi:hypothetical protein